jgi:hypothetical protein
MVIFPRGSDLPRVRALARVHGPRLATPAMPASPHVDHQDSKRATTLT